MSATSTPTKQFTEKYEQAGFVTGKLLDNFFRHLINLIPAEAQNILEAGCGAGYSTDYLRKHLPASIKLSASDVDPVLVDLAQKRTNGSVPCTQESIYELQRSDAEFDLVLALEVLEHLDSPDAALHELKRVTKKYVIISVPNEPLWRFLNFLRGKYWRTWGNTPGHINHWSANSLKKLLEKDFDVLAIKKPLPWLMILAKKKDA